MIALLGSLLAPLAPALVILGPIWQFATSRFGLPIVVAGGVILFYEGIPLGPVRDIPYLGSALSGLVDGRVDREYAEGRKAEEALWQEKMRLAVIAQAAEAKTRQADIDAAAQQYIDQQDVDALKISALEDELAKERANAKPKPPGDPAASCVATPGGVSTRLDAIGR